MLSYKIRISFDGIFPYINRNCSRTPHFRAGSTCPMPGIAVEIVVLLTNYLNLTIEEVKFGEIFFDAVHENKTDMFAIPFTENTREVKAKFDFTRGIYQEDLKVIVRKTDHSLKSLFGFFNIYRFDTWICMIFVFLLFTAFGLLVRFVECKLMLRKECNGSEILWKMVRFQLIQSEKVINYNLAAGRSSLLVFSIFQVCVILGLFQGFVLTNVVKKPDYPPFNGNDFAQLVMEKKLTIVKTENTNWIFKEIEDSYESPFYELREAIKFNPYKEVKTHADVIQAVEEGNGKIVGIIEEKGWYRGWAEKYCNLILVDALIKPKFQRFMFKKGSEFVPLFNKAIDANLYLIEKILHKYDYRPSAKCEAKQNTGPTPLTVAPYYGLLIPFVVGMTSSCVIFSGELLNLAMFWK